MSAPSVIRAGVIGVLALVLPTVALGVAEVFILRGLGFFLGLLCVTLVLVAGLAWVCVRVAHFQPGLAMFLTTIPFGIVMLMTVRSIGTDNPAAFLIALVQLLVAVFVAWSAARLARR
jgi:hypothetical protein